MTTLNLVAGGLRLTCDRALTTLTISESERDLRLATVPLAGLMVPVLTGGSSATVDGCDLLPDRLRIRWSATGVRDGATEVRIAGDHLELSSRFTPIVATRLERFDLFPAGTALNLMDVVNFRNRHHTHHTWPELPLGGKGCATNTYSTDWQFAPHPTMFILRSPDAHLLVGALDLTTAYGMYFTADDQHVRQWHLDYGGAHGQELGTGEVFQAPRFALFLDRQGDVHATVKRWTGLLIRGGVIPDPARKVRHGWHAEPLYCTWIDQCGRAVFTPPAELKDQAVRVSPAVRILTADFVREALAVIRRERLPVRTILLDDGWALARGQWQPHPERFPDLRGLVDEIHAAGLKVMVWWGWPEIHAEAEIDPRFLIGGGKRNRHGARMFDFSSPVTRDEYLEPFFHKLFSSDPGCFDLDGVKTDFIADKVHADMSPHDPAWRGEENYFVRFYELFHGLMRRHKPDAMHLGCAGHPWLATVTEANRTFDVCSSDVREHEQRGLMLQATCPGCPVSLDFHNYVERFDDWFALGRRHGWPVEIGNIMAMKRDALASWEPADAAYLAQVRRGLEAAVAQSAPARA
jgi:hypothetical protein